MNSNESALINDFTDFLNLCQIKYDHLKIYPISIEHSIIGVEKWNWDYQESLTFQYKSVDYVKKHPKIKIFIFCNHPRVFTLGRGLQKKKGKNLPGLIPFSEEDQILLDYPLHRIKRGGGITFHHTGQWIFYPIINLNIPNWGLSKHVDWLLGSTTKIIKSFFDRSNVTAHKKFAGIWDEDSKIGSVGVGIYKFVTFHGLALNLIKDDKIYHNLRRINPCGLNPSIYKALNDFIKPSKKNDLLNFFHNKYLESLSVIISQTFPFSLINKNFFPILLFL